MPLARMMLSRSQRCASKRRTCGSPRLSRTGCGGRITFITFLLLRQSRWRKNHSGLPPTALRISVQRTRSSWKTPAALSGPTSRTGSKPSLTSSVWNSPSASACWVTALMRSRIGPGVPAGAKMPNVVCATMPGSPRFGRGWKVGRAPDARLRIHRQDADLAGAMEIENVRGGVGREHRDLPADHVGDGLGGALFWDGPRVEAAPPLLLIFTPAV